MFDLIKATVLGIIEGLTEFLPISSTGHLIIGSQILNFRPQLQGIFEIFIQLGAIVAVLIYYAQDLAQDARTIHKDESVQRWWLAILVAALPLLALGFVFSDALEVFLRPSIVGLSMIVGGIIIYAAEIYESYRVTTLTTVPPTPSSTLAVPEGEVTVLQALVIGLFQLLALMPGMSRSATTIIGGMFAGLSRSVATRFSFYLSMPVLGSATIYSLLKHLPEINNRDMLLLIVGAIVSGIVALGMIAWLLRYVSRNNFVPFAVYRIIVGIIILLLVYAGILT